MLKSYLALLLSGAGEALRHWLRPSLPLYFRSFTIVIKNHPRYGRIGVKGKNRSAETHMPTHKFTAEILNAAIVGFEQQKLRIDAQIAELRQMLGGGLTDTAAAPELPKGKRRKMSAAARKRIGDAQRKRWAESKKESAPSSPVAPEAPKLKRRLSAAGKKAIGDATRKRWAR